MRYILKKDETSIPSSEAFTLDEIKTRLKRGDVNQDWLAKKETERTWVRVADLEGRVLADIQPDPKSEEETSAPQIRAKDPDLAAAVLLTLLFGTLGLAYVRGWGVALQATVGGIALLLITAVILPELLLVAVPALWVGLPIYAYYAASQKSIAKQEAASRCKECGMSSPEHKSWCVAVRTNR